MNRLLRICGLFAVALGLTPAPAALAQTGCAPQISINPRSGPPSQAVLVTGFDFYENCSGDPRPMRGIAIQFAQADRTDTLAVVDAAANGQFETQVRVPTSARAGEGAIRARGPDGSLLAAQTFQVTPAPTARPVTPATPPPATPSPAPTAAPVVATPSPSPEATASPSPTARIIGLLTPEPTEQEPVPEPETEPARFSWPVAIGLLIALAVVMGAIALIASRRDRGVAAAWGEQTDILPATTFDDDATAPIPGILLADDDFEEEEEAAADVVDAEDEAEPTRAYADVDEDEDEEEAVVVEELDDDEELYDDDDFVPLEPVRDEDDLEDEPLPPRRGRRRDAD